MSSESGSQYTVLARRFRPQSFDEVVGQEHVGQSIKNAIRAGRVAHAYLFTGARGVGKTSTARIFAKALNCPHTQDGVPCNQCEVCAGISAGNDMDVPEIDGASNRGIDDIRQLRANVNVRSMRSPYKVYIIDEVHMLTKEAFNALLKTLEEPPPNVKFVFCTTEPNKVPDTILSRCQRFDFGTIAQASIADRLRQIAIAEGKEVDEEAIELVARRAAGSMRDSQSLFDQLLAFGGEKITALDVHQLLGTAPDDRLMDLFEAFISHDPALALQKVESALQEGVQIGSFSDQLLAYFRDLLLAATGASEVPLSAITETGRDRLADQAKRWGLTTITAGMQILAESKFRMQRVNYSRALLELAIVRIATLENLDQIAALVEQVSTGTPAAPASPASPSPRTFGQATPPVKKNSEPVPPRPSVAAVPEAPSVTVEAKELTEESLPEFWSRLLTAVPESVSGHLRKAAKQAISGPNRLEISFPKSYPLSKVYCERPETVNRLRSVTAQLTGHPVEFRFAVDASAPAVSRTSAPKTAQIERKKPSTVERDPFVQMAVSVFGGQVVEVRSIPMDALPDVADHEDEAEG